MRTSVDTSTASKCVTGIYTSNYNVTFYDIDENNNIYMKDYAVKLTNQSVVGLYLPPATTTSTSTIVTLPSSSPTTFYTDNTSSKSLCYFYIYHIIIITAGSVRRNLPVIIIIGLLICA